MQKLFLSLCQSAPVILDAVSEFLDEAVVDDWVCRVVDEIEINKPRRVQRIESNKKEISVILSFVVRSVVVMC